LLSGKAEFKQPFGRGWPTFGPDGYHVMLTEMMKPLTAGETFPVMLTFANSAPR
jgi:copper(I)-binding protein